MKEEKKLYFGVWKMWKNITISSKYHVWKFLDLFSFCDKNLEKSPLLLRKCIICYKYIDSWAKLTEKSFSQKKHTWTV